jgi:hypothetical protein
MRSLRLRVRLFFLGFPSRQSLGGVASDHRSPGGVSADHRLDCAEREGKAVLVYTDESYLHQNHAPGKSWISMNKDGDVIDRGTSRGRRLVMLHAITRDGPLVTNDAAGNPIETLQWKAKATDKKETDTPHPIDGADGETLTAELLWVAQSHTGDYHDNVRSNRQHKRGVLEL